MKNWILMSSIIQWLYHTKDLLAKVFWKNLGSLKMRNRRSLSFSREMNTKLTNDISSWIIGPKSWGYLEKICSQWHRLGVSLAKLQNLTIEIANVIIKLSLTKKFWKYQYLVTLSRCKINLHRTATILFPVGVSNLTCSQPKDNMFCYQLVRMNALCGSLLFNGLLMSN